MFWTVVSGYLLRLTTYLTARLTRRLRVGLCPLNCFLLCLPQAHHESITWPRELPNFMREYLTSGESLHTSSGKPADLSPFNEVAWSTFAERSQASSFFSPRKGLGRRSDYKGRERCSRYGSDTCNQVYIYGGLNSLPTIMKRAFGMSRVLGG